MCLFIKCRITSSLTLFEIKKKIRPDLEKYNYFLWPTLLKATRTRKAGWLYLAHPDLTNRSEILDKLSGIVVNEFSDEKQFQPVPELETITWGNRKIQQRVLTLRCGHNDVDSLRELFMAVFAPDSKYNIGYMARYTFIPSQPVANCSWAHLQSLLLQQQEFHRNVQWLVMFGVQNIDTEFEEHRDQPPVTQEHAASDKEPADVTMADQSDDLSTTNTSVQPLPPVPKFSLRYLLYNQVNSCNETLIHSVYSSSDVNKIYVLCSEANKNQTLQVLHNLESLIQTTFGQSAIDTYIPRLDGKSPYIPGYPVVTQRCQTTANSLIDLSAANPQEEDEDQPKPSNKRQHTGLPKEDSTTGSTHPTYARATQQTVQLTANMTETTSRLKSLEQNNRDTEVTLKSLSARIEQNSKTLSKQGENISKLSDALVTQGQAIELIQQSQEKQNTSMVQLNKSQTHIIDKVNRLLARHDCQNPHGLGDAE